MAKTKTKLKIRSSIARRFKLTNGGSKKKGKLMAARSFNSHLARKKRGNTKRRLDIKKEYTGKIGKRIRLLLGA